jgi:hypothetical protein
LIRPASSAAQAVANGSAGRLAANALDAEVDGTG